MRFGWYRERGRRVRIRHGMHILTHSVEKTTSSKMRVSLSKRGPHFFVILKTNTHFKKRNTMEKKNQSKDEKRSADSGTSTTKKSTAGSKTSTGSKAGGKSTKDDDGEKSASRTSSGTKDSGKSK